MKNIQYTTSRGVPHQSMADEFLCHKNGSELGFTEAGGKKFSCGWKVEMSGIKDVAYTVIPKIDGQLNPFYFELLADIKDKAGNDVGYCVVELLPGVYNETSALAAFARVK